MLNGDWAFDDPAGRFPAPLADLAPPPPTRAALAAHLATIQGVLGLTADEITAILADAGTLVTTATVVVDGNNVSVPSLTLTNLSICYRYSALAKCLQLSISDLIALKAMSGVDPFHPVGTTPVSVLADDVLYNQALLFVKQVATVQNSGFTVEDLKYLLRQQFDPVGKYQNDPNALMNLVQTLSNGLRQIQVQNALPSNLTNMAESLIDQTLFSILPAPILKSLFTLLTDSQTYTASQAGVAAANQIDASAFANETEISIAYDTVTQTQTVTYKGLLLNWKKSQLEKINTSTLFGGLLNQLQSVAQRTLAQRVADLLGVWASLAEYEAVQTGVTTPLVANDAAALMAEDSALALSYDQSDQLQWLAYRGVLTDAKMAALTSVPVAAPQAALLAGLLGQIQQQTPSSYRQLVGSVLAMWVNAHTYVSTQPTASAIDSVTFFQALDAKQQDGTIAEPIPELQFSYTNGVQTLVCAGILTDALRLKLEALPPASALLGSLLQDVRNQTLQEFQVLALGVLTVSASDLDTFSAPFVGVNPSKQQTQVKAQLVQAFLPLFAQKVSRQFVVQTLTSNLGADPILTEALLTDAALLSDPANDGKSLLSAFLAVGRQGISAAYYSSTNGTGTPQASGIAATTDTADPTNANPPTGSAHFEGYLQVPTDGPYRFFAELGDAGAGALLQLDSPDPTALFANPIISPNPPAATAAEVSQFVQLKGGVAYHFTLDFSALGTHGASLLIQGETLPKGPLSQVVLCPQQAIGNFTRAQTLLAKALQILQVTGLDVREVSYLADNAAQFSGFDLGSLPTKPADDSPANTARLFAQFLTLADYADLRKGPAGGTDTLVDIFQSARQSSPQEPNTPWTILGNLTRRNPQLVHDVAAGLGSGSHFQNNVGIRRVWDALQLVQMVGIPVASLAASTWIASPKPPADPSPDQIATNFKNAVKAQYTLTSGGPSPNRSSTRSAAKKRDALVAYLVHASGFENSNQLFEYFLVDPGMEPVVQTSRLRLAHVVGPDVRPAMPAQSGERQHQLPARNVAPSAIDADWWEWMKRYRVWQANREIFLFPENWMEPELRLDKTDLFQTLESELLQGDVTSDLVEDAFLTYLKGLDVRARLDIVATIWTRTPRNPGLSTLHVLGRTYGHPHKYFYRTYSSGTWSGWEAVTPDIEGNHIVLAMWRGRLNLFWLTFITKQQGLQEAPAASPETIIGITLFGAIAGNMFSARPQRRSINCTGANTSREMEQPESTDVNKFRAINVFDGFNPGSFISTSPRRSTTNGNEGAVKIHLDLNLGGLANDIGSRSRGHHLELLGTGLGRHHCGFRVTSKNAIRIADAYLTLHERIPISAPALMPRFETGIGSLTSL